MEIHLDRTAKESYTTDDTLHRLNTENRHLFPLDLFWKHLETHLPACTPVIYSQSRWVGGFVELHHHRRVPLSPPHLRNAGLMGISQREATFQSTRPRHTCRAPGVSCLHHASLDTGTGIDTSSASKSSIDPRVYQNSQQHGEKPFRLSVELLGDWTADTSINKSKYQWMKSNAIHILILWYGF